MDRIGNKSIQLNFEVRRKGEIELVATAHFIMAAVRKDTLESVSIPDLLRERLKPYLRLVEV